MFKVVFSLLLFVSMQTAWSFVNVDWVCPKNSSRKINIEVSFDESGRMTFKPDIFRGTLKSGSAEELSNCIHAFQKGVHEKVSEYRDNSCKKRVDILCTSRIDYINERVLEKIKASNLVKKAAGVTVGLYVPDIIRPRQKSVTAATTAINEDGSPKQTRIAGKDPLSLTAQAYLEYKVSKGDINLKNLNQTFQYLGRPYKVSDFDKVIANHADQILSSMTKDEARQYVQNYMVLNSGVLKATPSDKRTAVLDTLNLMMRNIYGDRGKEELAKMLECAPEDNTTPISTVLQHVEESINADQCSDLSPGKHKVFEHKEFYSSGDYLLRRKPDGSYQAILNVQFKQGSGTVVKPSDMMERAKKCLENASTAMKGPNGEKMELTVLTPSETLKLPADQRPKMREVSIEGPTFMSNAAQYSESANCGVITHEMLHLLGLCDEYKENRPAFAANNWTCRVETKAPSLMRDTALYDQAIPKTVKCNCTADTCKNLMSSQNDTMKKLYLNRTFYDYTDVPFRNKYCEERMNYKYGQHNVPDPENPSYLKSESEREFVIETRSVSASDGKPYYAYAKSDIRCACPAGDADCMAIKKQVLENIKTTTVKDNCPAYSDKASESFGSTGNGSSYSNGTFTMHSDPVVKSLLQPAHFYKILYGNCKNSKVDNYNECAEWAYKDPSKEPNRRCNVPQKCKSDSYYLGSPQ